MIKEFSLLLGILLAPADLINESDIARYEIALQMRKMIGLPADTRSPLTPSHFRATPKTFCAMMLNEYQRELMCEFEHLGIKLDDHKDLLHQKKRKRLATDHADLLDTQEIASESVKTVVYQLANKRGLTQKIRVLNSKDNTDFSTAGVAEITFNEERWEDYFDKNNNVLTFIAGHEVAHLYHEDIVSRTTIEEFIEKNSHVKQADAKEYFLKFCRFTEVRADIESTFDSKRALKGFSFWAKRDIEIDGDTGGDTMHHPFMSDRLQLAQLLKTVQNTYKPQPRKYKAIQ